MLKIILIMFSAMFLSSLTHPVFAADSNNKSDGTTVQRNDNSNFENWYEPDDAYQSNDQNKQPPTNTVSPNGGVDEPRVAPLEDTRQKIN